LSDKKYEKFSPITEPSFGYILPHSADLSRQAAPAHSQQQTAKIFETPAAFLVRKFLSFQTGCLILQQIYTGIILTQVAAPTIISAFAAARRALFARRNRLNVKIRDCRKIQQEQFEKNWSRLPATAFAGQVSSLKRGSILRV
jgi:hypothetical protein